MTWLMLAKMPLLMSSRMMSAGLTPRSSASSLTVIDEGMSIEPRTDGSIVWTALSPEPSARRWGFRGPRVLRVPLRLRAMGTSRKQLEIATLQAAAQFLRQRHVEGALEGGFLQGERPARAVGAEIGAAAGQATGGIDGDEAIGCADDTHQIALVALGAAGDAGAGRSTPDGRRGGGYDDTSEVAVARLRFGAVAAFSGSDPFESAFAAGLAVATRVVALRRAFGEASAATPAGSSRAPASF